MPERQISELPVVTDFDESSILHTKEQDDNSDRQVTVQEVLDLVPDPTENVDPPEEATFDATNDLVVFADDSDGDLLKKIDAASIFNAVGVPTLSGDVTNGNYKIGDLEIRWGQRTSTTNSEEAFTFSVPFTNACYAISLQSYNASNSTKVLPITSFDEDGFSVDRDFASSVNRPFFFIALGR